MIKKSILLFFSVFLIEGPLLAQNNFQENFDSFFKDASNEFEDFRDRTNAQYADFLLTSWKEFEAFSPVSEPYEKPVPPVPYKKKEEGKAAPAPVPFDVVVPVIKDNPKAKPVKPIKGKDCAKSETFDFHFDFHCYGMDLSVRVPSGKKFKLASVSPMDLSKGWKKLSGKDYDNTVADLLDIRSEKKLCDWAYLQVLWDFSEAYLEDGDSATFLSAFLLSQSGYKMRLGTDGNSLCFLYGTDFLLYEKAYFNLDGTNYFIYGDDKRNIMIADIPYPDESGLSLIISGIQNLGEERSTDRSFSSDRYSVTAGCSVSLEQMKFFNTYPSSQIGGNFLTKWAIYAKTPLDDMVKEQLYPGLKKKIEGKSDVEAADILLDFVQTSLEYDYDTNVWGRERAFFAEETLYYPYCDCEDRSILYSHLIRDLLDLDVVLVYYPGHLATAVKFRDGPAGDYLQLPEGNFTICDPTFIGAPVGNTMPSMDNNQAKVILL